MKSPHNCSPWRHAGFFWICAALLVPLAVMALVAALHFTQQVPLPLMTRDVAALGKLPPLAGFVSALGVLLWCATAAVCLYVALTQRRALMQQVYRFVLCAGLLSAYLTFDDCFQFHEDLSPRLLGLRERYVYLLLAGTMAAFLFTFRAVIRRTAWPMLALALGLLGLSALFDTFLLGALRESIGDWQFYWEDGLKLFGITAWFGYFVHSCTHASTIAVQPQRVAVAQPMIG